MAMQMIPAAAGKIGVNDLNESIKSSDTPKRIGCSVKCSSVVLIPSSNIETGGPSREAKTIIVFVRI